MYELRFMFDPGSGVCLWAANDKARERYGYPIDHWQLPLPENTRRWLSYLIAWYDTSIDWAYPSDSDDVWSIEESNRFREAADKGIALVREGLGAEYAITE